MPSNAPQIQMAKGDFLDASLYTESDLKGLPTLSRGTLVMGLSRAFDLAEGRPSGHALRVALIATSIANEMGVSRRRVEEVFFAGLLHDAGMIGNTQPGSDGEGHGPEAARQKAITRHCTAGAQMARKLGLPENVARAIEHHHAGGHGSKASRPGGEPGLAIARIVAAADQLDSMIEAAASPLLIRRQGQRLFESFTEQEIDVRVAEMAVRVVSGDGFWLGLHDNDVARHLSSIDSGGALDIDELMDWLGVISDAIDARSGRQAGRGRKIGELAAAIARRKGVVDGRVDLIEAAALLQDIGTLGVPAAYLNKPDIFTIDEMASMQLHPAYARDILSEIPGFGAIAWWVGCHHERIDGKGYPGMLEGSDVPVEAQIIGMAEALIALRSSRPYRPAMPEDEALGVIRGMCGTRFDESLIACLDAALDDVSIR